MNNLVEVTSMKKIGIVAGLLLLVSVPLLAGVVFEIEVKDHDASPPTTSTTEVRAEGKNLKMGIQSGSGGSESEAIFRGDRRQMVVVDHDDKSYMVVDEEAIRQIAGQVGQAMSQIEEALKNVPENQRAMVEKMMKERMPQQAQQAERVANVVRKTGERGDKNGYPCVKYEVTREGRPVREMWVTDWDNVEGGDEVMGSFQEMSRFFEEMLDAIAGMAGGAGGLIGGADNFMVDLDKVGGFPVVVRELDDSGALESESNLRSSRRRTLDPAEFEPPAGYKRRQMFPQ